MIPTKQKKDSPPANKTISLGFVGTKMYTLNCTKKERKREGERNLGSKKNSLLMQVESEVAGQVESPRQPPPGGDVEQATAHGRVPAEMGDRRRERPGVQRLPVADRPELRHRGTVSPAAHCAVLEGAEALHDPALGSTQNHHESHHECPNCYPVNHLWLKKTKKMKPFSHSLIIISFLGGWVSEPSVKKHFLRT